MSVRTVRAAAALAGVVVGAAGLVGCGVQDAVSDKAAEKATEKLIEKAAENGASGDVDVDLDGEEFKVETSDGTFSMGGDVPEDFPAEVPLLDGEVTVASSTGDGWAVMLEVDGAHAEVATAAADAILDAGFTEEGRTTAQDYLLLVAAGDDYELTLTVAPVDSEGSRTTVSYTVVPAS